MRYFVASDITWNAWAMEEMLQHAKLSGILSIPSPSFLFVIFFMFLSQYLAEHPIFCTSDYPMQFSILLFTPASPTPVPHTVWGFLPFSTHSLYQAIIASWQEAFNSALIKYDLWTFPCCKRSDIYLCSKVDGFTLKKNLCGKQPRSSSPRR